MGETLASVLAALTAIVVFGAFVTRSLRFPPLGFALPLVVVSLGSLAIACGAALLVALDVAMTPLSTTLAALVPSAIVVALARKHVAAGAPPHELGSVRAWWCVAVAWFLFALHLSIVSNGIPIILGDDFGIWSAKAKVLYGASGTTASVGDLLAGGRVPNAISCVAHSDYPWFNPLLQAHVHAYAGEITHCTPRAPMQLMAFCAILAAIEIVRRARTPLWLGIPLVAALALAPTVVELLETALAESLVFSGVTLLVFARSFEHRTRAILSGLGLFVVVTAKNEGLAILLAWLVADWFATRESVGAGWRTRLSTATPAVAAALVHWAMNFRLGLQNDLVAGDSGWEPLSVLRWFTEDVVLDWYETHLLVAAALLAVVAGGRRLFASSTARFSIALWLLVSAAYLFTFTTTHHDADWHWSTAGPRVWVNLLPAAVALVARFVATSRPAEQGR